MILPRYFIIDSPKEPLWALRQCEVGLTLHSFTKRVDVVEQLVLRVTQPHSGAGVLSPNVEGVVAQKVCICGIGQHAGGQGLGMVRAQAPAGRPRSKVPEEDAGIRIAAAA